MTETHQVTGLFRDRGQAVLAVAAARRQGLDVEMPDDLVEDASGVHVVLSTAGGTDDARSLLLTYGAYSATVS